MPSASLISIAPVKGFVLVHPNEVELGRDGVSTNRRFYVVAPGRVQTGDPVALL